MIRHDLQPAPAFESATPAALSAGLGYAATGTALVSWGAPLWARLPPLRPGLLLRELGGSDLRRLLRAHRHLVATLLLLGILAGLAGALTAQPDADAETLLMIADDDNGVVPAVAGGAPTDRLQGDIALLHSDAVANRVVQQVGLAALFPDLTHPMLFGLPFFGLGEPAAPAEQMRRAAARVKARISATAVPGAAMLRVGYQDADPVVALRALKTVVAAYIQQRVNLVGGNTGRLVERDAEQTAEQMRDIDSQIQKLRADYQIVDLDQDTAGATARLDDIMKRESQVRARQQAVAAERAAAAGQLQAAPQRVFDAQEVSAHPLDEARATLLALRLERDHMATQYAPTYPALVELERKIATAQQSLQQSGKPTVSATRDVRNPALDVLRNRANDLQIEAAGLGRQLAALETDYAPAYARVTELREAETRMHDLQYRRGVLESVGRQISVREMSLRVEDSVAQARRAQVHVLQAAAAAPGDGPGWVWWLTGGVLGGGAAAGLGGWLAARLRPTYVLAREVERHLGLPVLAEFPAGDPALLAQDSHDQVVAIAAMLADSQVEGRSLFSLQAITPDADADQLTLAQSLAHELADGYGLRTLVIEVGDDGIAVPLALDGPGFGAALPAALAAASLPLWEGAPAIAIDRPDFFGIRGETVPATQFTADTLAGLRQSCDRVVILANGAAAGAAARRLSGYVDAALLVVAAQATRSAQALALTRSVAAGGGQMLGVVMTGRSYPTTIW